MSWVDDMHRTIERIDGKLTQGRQLMSQNPNAYFSMDKIALNALVATGEPDQVNGAQAELDRRRANKAAKRAARQVIVAEETVSEEVAN